MFIIHVADLLAYQTMWNIQLKVSPKMQRKIVFSKMETGGVKWASG